MAKRLPQKGHHQREVLGEVPSDEELFADVLARVAAHLGSLIGVVEQTANAECASLRRVDRVAGDAPDNLHRNPARETSNDGFALPHSLGHGETEGMWKEIGRAHV